MTARFGRALSPAVLPLFDPGGWLAPLARPWTVRTPTGTLGVHLQLRESDHVTLYRGSSKVFDVAVRPGRATFTATTLAPAEPAASALLRTWHLGEPGLAAAVEQ